MQGIDLPAADLNKRQSMLSQERNKLKWNTVMSAVVLITIGIFMIIFSIAPGIHAVKKITQLQKK